MHQQTCRIAAVLALLLAGCAETNQRSGGEPLPKEVRYLAKSDIDTVADVHLQQVLGHLRRLSEKIYRRNPRFCKASGRTVETCVERIFGDEARKSFPELGHRHGTGSIELAFDEGFSGDRVLALSYGLKTMILDAYNNKTEFYLYDELDPQKLYNSARNVEIAVWRLSNKRDPSGNLYLLSNAVEDDVQNLSYERLFGKIISLQDTLAQIVAENTRRRIKNVIQSMATAVFLPI